MTNPNPNSDRDPRHLERGARAAESACWLVGYEIAEHTNRPDIRQWGEIIDTMFDAMSDEQVNDVGDALVALLRYLVGREPTEGLMGSLPENDMRAVAQLVAHAVDYKGWTVLDACRTFTKGKVFWRDVADIRGLLETPEPPTD